MRRAYPSPVAVGRWIHGLHVQRLTADTARDGAMGALAHEPLRRNHGVGESSVRYRLTGSPPAALSERAFSAGLHRVSGFVPTAGHGRRTVLTAFKRNVLVAMTSDASRRLYLSRDG